MPLARRLVTALSAAGLVAAGSLAAASPAHAATCVGAGCNGRSPVGTTCASDARTLDHIDLAPGEGDEGWVTWTLELRNSPSCQASWSRATGRINWVPDSVIGVTVTIGAWSRLNPALPVTPPAPTHYRAEKYVKAVKGTTFQFSTAMVNDNANYQVRSCSSAYVGSLCTAWQHL